jgi:hypothetical protein
VSHKSFSRGARTHACRVHTRVNAKVGVSAGPRVIIDGRNDASSNRVPLNVSSNPIPFSLISYPMIVRFPLPEWLASPVEKPICFAHGSSLQRLEQLRWRCQRQQEYMNVVRHDDEWPKLVLTEFNAPEQRIYDELRDTLLSQERRPRAGRVKVSVNPSERFTRRKLRRRREFSGGQRSVQSPGHEQPTSVGINMWEAALGGHLLTSAARAQKISRSHECERGTQECVRHIL